MILHSGRKRPSDDAHLSPFYTSILVCNQNSTRLNNGEPNGNCFTYSPPIYNSDYDTGLNRRSSKRGVLMIDSEVWNHSTEKLVEGTWEWVCFLARQSILPCWSASSKGPLTRKGENGNFQTRRNGLKIRDPDGLRVGVCRSVVRFVYNITVRKNSVWTPRLTNDSQYNNSLFLFSYEQFRRIPAFL